MLLIVGTVRLPPENVETARIAMAAMVSASLAEDGCLDYAYAEDMFDRGLIHVKEIWRDQAALDRHFKPEHLEIWRACWPELGIGDRNLNVYDVGKGRST
jgi:quinol monooxygenase YgiN